MAIQDFDDEDIDFNEPEVDMSKAVWARTCQECGNVQRAKKPATDRALSSSYENSKCRKCRSESLDYGSLQVV